MNIKTNKQHKKIYITNLTCCFLILHCVLLFSAFPGYASPRSPSFSMFFSCALTLQLITFDKNNLKYSEIFETRKACRILFNVMSGRRSPRDYFPMLLQFVCICLLVWQMVKAFLHVLCTFEILWYGLNLLGMFGTFQSGTLFTFFLWQKMTDLDSRPLPICTTT